MKSLRLRQRACQAGILPCLDQNLPSPCFQITIESNSNTSSTFFLQILRAIDALCRFKHFCSGKRYFPELFCREESCLIAVVRGLLRGHVTPERLNRPGILFALVIPLDKLKKTVPGNPPEPAPIRGSAIDGSQRIRTSPQWQVYLTSNQSIDLTPRNIQATKVLLEVPGNSLESLPDIGCGKMDARGIGVGAKG